MLKPLQDYVILKKGKAEKQTASGIILTSPKEDATNQAKVIAVGPKCEGCLKVDLEVIFKEYSGTKFKENDNDYIIIEEKDILAVIE